MCSMLVSAHLHVSFSGYFLSGIISAGSIRFALFLASGGHWLVDFDLPQSAFLGNHSRKCISLCARGVLCNRLHSVAGLYYNTAIVIFYFYTSIGNSFIFTESKS